MEYFEILSIDQTYIVFSTILKGVAWACVIIAVSIDLYHGIRKSKKSGEFTNSYGLRRTVDKCNKYLTLLCFMLLADVFWHISSSLFLPYAMSIVPIFTFFGAGVLVYNEWVSVREKIDQKMLNKINRSKDELLSIAFTVAEAYKNNPDALAKLTQSHRTNMERKEENDGII